MTIFSSQTGNNADLISAVASLYLKDGWDVADTTWGKGVFWRKTPPDRFTLRGSDLNPEAGVTVADFTALPDADGSFDLVVFDPPYVHNPGKHITDSRYNNAATTEGMYHRDILALYVKGMAEARRVLRGGGSQLWVKCKDEVESGKQCWSHVEILHAAEELGFFARDLFVLVPDSRTSSNRWARQIHARKSHSYLWVFEVPKEKRQREDK